MLEAELYVSSATIGFIHEGEPVLLRYAAFPYQRFGLSRSHVREITHVPIAATDTSSTGQHAAPTAKDRIRHTVRKRYFIKEIFHYLLADHNYEYMMIDNTIIRTYQQGAGLHQIRMPISLKQSHF